MVYIYYQTHGSGSDTLWNINDSLRIRYYGLTSVPTTFADGCSTTVGSGGVQADSATFARWYNSRRAVPSPLQMTLSGTYNPSSRQGQAKVTITATDSVVPASLRIRYLLLENLPYSWGSDTTVIGIDHVQRAMLPDWNGVPLTISNGQTVPDSQSFTMQNVLNPDSTEIAVFVQSDSTKEILQGVWADVAGFTGVQGNPAEELPASLSLSAPSPSPLHGAGRITFALPRETDVTLKVYNLLGQEIRTLAAGHKPAGRQTVSWDARDKGGNPVPGGVYFFRLEAQGRSLTSRAVVLR
jgi:hypothetical protein